VNPPITVGSAWPAYDFTWSGWPLPLPIAEGAFTYSSSGVTHVMVTDDFCRGDAFQVLDNLVSLGTTPLVASDWDGVSCPDNDAGIGPDAAYADSYVQSRVLQCIGRLDRIRSP